MSVANPSNLLVSPGSMRGQLALRRSESALQNSIRNLSTGVRIHTAKDDPPGFVASTALKSETTALSHAVTNCQRSTSVIATVDNALSHVSSLLTDLRGLITQAASTGGETKETLSSLQMQADAIVETINFISETTSFQGQKLLDGSFDFNTYGIDSSKISLLNINQANFQGRTEKDIVVQVHQPAKQAELYYPYGSLKENTVLTLGGTGGYSSFSFDKDATAQQIADEVNKISDSTGIGATVFSKSNPGSLVLTSYGKNNDVLITASEPGTAAGNFVFRYTAPKEGNAALGLNVSEGDGNNPTVVEIVLQTDPGGNVVSTAEQVVNFLNTSPLLKNADGTGRITAANPTGSTGLGTVTPFAEVGYFGSTDENNYLQFLAPAGSPAIKFVSTPNTPLSVDDTTNPPVYEKASAVVQGFEAGTTFTLRALTTGPEGDNVKVIFQDNPAESATYDPISKSVIISADFTGRANDPERSDFSMNDLLQLAADSPEVNSRFSITPQAAYSQDNPPTFSSSAYQGINAQLGETSGGVVSPGNLTIHLETDADGNIKTTANDLVKFFNDPSTVESKAVLDRWGISVACLDPSNTNLTACTIGQASFGTGTLSPTYDANLACPPETGYPDVVFASYGNDVREEHATATITSNGGRNADWTLTAKHAGAAYNNVAVRLTTDPEGPKAAYDSVLKVLTVSVNTVDVNETNPSSAADIVNLINNDPALNTLFAASLPTYSTGEGIPSVSDRAVLTGGIQSLDTKPMGSVIAANGINATFNIEAKHSDAKYNNTELLVVPDSSGPKVSYDTQSKQLTIGIDPEKPITAAEIVALINQTPEISDLFSASIPPMVAGTSVVPDGSGLVSIGDFGTLQAKTVGASMGAAMLGATDNESLGIMFHSVEFGSQEFVEVYATQGKTFAVTDRFGTVTERTTGTDVVADINGRRAIGEGRTALSVTSDLDISVAMDSSVLSGEVFGFRISGGGTLMQLGPKAVWSQQVRISIPSVYSTALGGETGTLSQLKTDEPYSLLKNVDTAFKILEEVEVQVASLRGRLGALQKTRIDTSLDNMSDAIIIGEDARSQIADVEFATESSNLTRQQVLMQSAVAVLQQSGQTKQLLLSLLQG